MKSTKFRNVWRGLLGCTLLIAVTACGGLNSIEREMAEISAALDRLPLREPGESGGSSGIYLEMTREGPTHITIDLGQIHPIDNVVLVPTRLLNREGIMDVVGFPDRYEVLADTGDDFTHPIRLEGPADKNASAASGYPVILNGEGSPARYIRLVVQEASMVRGRRGVSLAEVFVFSGGRNVALRRSVDAPDSLTWEGVFAPAFLVDGQTSFGLPTVGQKQGPSGRGWHAHVQSRPESEAFVELRFATPQRVEEIRLYPVYHSIWVRSTDYGFPIHFLIELEHPTEGWQTIEDWSKRPFAPPGNSPACFPVLPQDAMAVRLRALSLPQSLPSRYIFALSEIEVFSEGLNVAPEATLLTSRQHAYNELEWNQASLMDGYTSEKKIIPLQQWLDGLARRGELEGRLAMLQAERDLAQKSLTQTLTWVIGALSLLLVTFGGIFLYGYSRRRRQIRALQSQIASDLHDDVGSNLASMTILASGMLEDTPITSPQGQMLQRLLEISRETFTSMHDIVWMLHPDRKANVSLTSKFREVTGNLLIEIPFTFEAVDEIGVERLKMDTLHDLLLFYKETLHNLARHSNAQTIGIKLSFTREQIQLDLTDDGAPSPEGQLPKGLQARAAKLGARLTYRSEADRNHLRLLIQ